MQSPGVIYIYSKINEVKTGFFSGIQAGRNFIAIYNDAEERDDLFSEYFRAGFEKNEYCLWLTAEPRSFEELIKGTGDIWINAGSCPESASFGPVSFEEIRAYSASGAVGEGASLLSAPPGLPSELAEFLESKSEEALSKGFSGLRAGLDFGISKSTGPEKTLLRQLETYSKALDETLSGKKILTLSIFPFKAFSLSETIELMGRGKETVLKKDGKWAFLKSPVVDI